MPGELGAVVEGDGLAPRGGQRGQYLHHRGGDGVRVLARRFALENYCTHEGAMLSYGDIGPGEVVCALHAAVFSLKTGVCLDGFTSDTVAYEAAVRDGRVWVVAPGESLIERPKPAPTG